MNAIIKGILTLPIAATLTGCCNSNSPLPAPESATSYKVECIGTMPDIEKGYAQGVSACYAATTDDALFIAGGCNFPETPAAEGGRKVYYRGIYRTNTDTPLHWEQIALLPEASAYGVSLQRDSCWYIIGGMNSDASTAKAYRINLSQLHAGNPNDAITELPPLPHAIDNAAGAIAGNSIYIAGGNADGKASNRAFVLNEGANSWQELPPMRSSARVEPVCAGTPTALYVWSGFTPQSDTTDAAVLCDGLRYDIASAQWEHIDTIKSDGNSITLSGGIATTAQGNIVAAGGVNKEIFLDAISGRYNLVDKKDYMLKPAEWYKFNNKLLVYNPDSACWNTAATDSCYARAGAQLIGRGKELFLIGGELKPGIRTPNIYRITTE